MLNRSICIGSQVALNATIHELYCQCMTVLYTREKDLTRTRKHCPPGIMKACFFMTPQYNAEGRLNTK